MPDLIIDKRPVSVPEGTSVIEAAERLGIMIPRFCWHKALKVAGACRMCAVMFLEGPVKGLDMSCSVLAAAGMVVSTDHPEAVDFRRHIIEWLMVNHPHDCPVCDEGGHCLLQDETISGNHCLRRYAGRKRTYQDQYLGPFVQHEMNRCIHCYRCSRFYQEVAGGRDFGPLQIANRVYFGRYEDGRLESAFSGNMVDLCPTGVLTDKTARFKARRWDLERAPSVCPHCSLGCNTTVAARYREVLRVEARLNEAVNGYFLCDRGRFSHGFSSLPGRPRRACADGKETTMPQALAQAAERLRVVAARHGPQAVACLSSCRATLETLGALAGLADAAGWTGPAVFSGVREAGETIHSVRALSPERVCSLAEVQRADAVLCLGLDPLGEAPMLALAMRQAALDGALVLVADPRPVALPLPFVHLPVHPRDLSACLEALTALATPVQAAALAAEILPRLLPGYPGLWPVLEKTAPALAACRRPVLAWGQAMPGVGTGAGPGSWTPLAGRISKAADILAASRDGCKLLPVLPGPNAFGAALLARASSGEGQPSHADVLAGIRQGRIKAVLAVECDPFDGAALSELETLVVLDCLPSRTAERADVFLPATTLFESGGTLANNEGRLQYASPVHACGLPVSQDGAGGHPPRAFDRALPGTEPRPAWAILEELRETLGFPAYGHPWGGVATAVPALAHLPRESYPFDGMRVSAAPASGDGFPDQLQKPDTSGRGGDYAVVWGEALFGTEELGSYSELVRQAAGETFACLGAEDAKGLGIAEKEIVVVTLGGRDVEVAVRIFPNMPAGVIVLPRLRGLAGPSGPGPECGTAAVRRKAGGAV
ncbi:NADH-quinone oxidoreductase subunit NuoG [Fundidesulfovibrio soli]|uniref:NADH-quinone oxidoreductase subunit NuoG n=1 Tax=Fundidesulfovibrio soli TaxID=2922716 RepID=UPI001FAED374|nr:NADH-quinone oxidoreductase subunit NuoG [Fundidesulfovibrio soli]